MGDPALIERWILELLARRDEGASLCPSEVARQLAETGWREWMPAVREAAARLAARGAIRVTQGARDVDPGNGVRGPVRLRRGAAFAAVRSGE